MAKWSWEARAGARALPRASIRTNSTRTHTAAGADPGAARAAAAIGRADLIDRPKATPDGEPRQSAKGRDRTAKSKVQDPLIAGDAGKAGKRVETDEANVDEAGEVRRKKGEVDLLH
jgi:hypothetical protein